MQIQVNNAIAQPTVSTILSALVDYGKYNLVLAQKHSLIASSPSAHIYSFHSMTTRYAYDSVKCLNISVPAEGPFTRDSRDIYHRPI